MADVGGNNAEEIGSGCPSGIMLGATSTEKVGFYGVTPVAQQSTAATCDSSSSAITLLNALKTACDNIGFTA